MNPTQITTSVALYFDQSRFESLSSSWLDRAMVWFEEYRLSPVVFTASGGKFLYDDCYVLDKDGEDIVRWNEVLPAGATELRNALKESGIKSLGLDSPREYSRNRSDWRANISASTGEGEVYFGFDEELVERPSELLRTAYEMASDVFDIRYGIAYKMPLQNLPDCYASGTGRTTFSQIQFMIRNRSEWDARVKTPDELWAEELSGRQRHLSGLFRGTYVANLLSDAHVRNAAIASRGIGQLSRLDDSNWLWEVPDSELAMAESVLEARGVLVSQAGED